MDTHALPPKATKAEADVLISPTQARAYTWASWLLSLVTGGLLLALMAAAFRGLTVEHPVSLIITLSVLVISHVAIRYGLSALRGYRAQRSPLTQRATATIAAMRRAGDNDMACSALIDVFCDEIAETLQPSTIDRAVYDPRSDGYLITREEGVLHPTHPHVVWISQRPDAVPLRLQGDRSRPAMERELWQRGYRILIPLGKSGWIVLGAPQDRDEYSRDQLAYLEAVSHRASQILQRTTLAEIQEQRSEELQVLYWIAQAVNFSTDVDTLLELVYTQLKRVMRLPNFYIALLDPDRDELSFAFYIENDERVYPTFTWPAHPSLTGVLLENNMTIRTDDYTETCRQRGLEPKGPIIPKAWMGTALSAGSRSIGVMVASTTSTAVQFTKTEENLFVTAGAYTAAILERRALYERLESRARQLTTLNAIGNLLASSLDLDEVLDLVVRNAAELLNSEAGSLLLLDEDTGDLVFRISSGPAGAQLVGMHMPAGKGIAGAAFSENRPIISQHTSQDSRWYPEFDKQAQFVTESVIAVPLNARGRTIGVLEVVNRKGARNFTTEDSELLLSFGAQAAITIENARLFTTTDKALQARVLELTTLQFIDRQLNATLDYGIVMQHTLEWALHITGASIGIVAALQQDDGGRRGLRFLAHQGYDDADMRKYHDGELWPLERGRIGHTVTLGETTLVTRSGSEHQDELEPGMAAQLTVPIKREARVIGAIVLESTEEKSFSDDHVAFVERLADHAAIAIDNSRLFEQVQSANAAKTEFVSFVSHELKQPMTSIKGYSDLLMQGVGGELTAMQRQFVTVVRNNVARMDRLVQDLLDMSRIEAGRLQLTMGAVVPAEIVAEATQAFKQEIAEKKQVLELVVQPDLPTVTGDRGRLIQVLTNLISNASKYTPEGGAITV
ncbi:MAG: GAF domain-containing protein, partial [Anaerolineae bacterium]|nr:GAF domain-containing protein [Anaerolineae bacterium]